jgi:hypothetical protein
MNFINKVIQSRRKIENQLWIENRLKHCINCSHNTKNTSKKTLKLQLIWQLSKLLNFIMSYTTKDLGQCDICYCPVNEKAKIKSEECSLTFLKQNPKWIKQD